MGIGVGIFLIAIGAILRFAVNVSADGVNLHTVGDILMVVGAVGVLWAAFFWLAWTRPDRDADVVVERERRRF